MVIIFMLIIIVSCMSRSIEYVRVMKPERAMIFSGVFRDRRPVGILWPQLLIFALVTLVPFFLTPEILSETSPITTIPVSGVLSAHQAVTIMFGVNILYFTVNAKRLGGMGSPFSPLLFMMPVLALFLRQPTDLIIVFLSATVVGFTYAVREAGFLPRRALVTFAYWFASIAALVLSTVLGIVSTKVGPVL